MYKRTTTIINPTGLHARPASDFVRAAAKFTADIKIGHAAKMERVSAKSILMILGLGLNQNTEVELIAEGPDEREAVDRLVALIESGFGE